MDNSHLLIMVDVPLKCSFNRRALASLSRGAGEKTALRLSSL